MKREVILSPRCSLRHRHVDPTRVGPLSTVSTCVHPSVTLLHRGYIITFLTLVFPICLCSTRSNYSSYVNKYFYRDLCSPCIIDGQASPYPGTSAYYQKRRIRRSPASSASPAQFARPQCMFDRTNKCNSDMVCLQVPV